MGMMVITDVYVDHETEFFEGGDDSNGCRTH